MEGANYQPVSLASEVATDRERIAFDRQAHRLAHPTNAGFYDPVAITLLVDGLLRIEHDTTIRARHLAVLLNAAYPNFYWRPVTVGRILGDLAEAAAVLDTDIPPITKAESYGGHRFAVNVTPSNWRWLIDVRTRMGALAERTLRIERATGVAERRQSFPFEALAEIEYVRDREVTRAA